MTDQLPVAILKKQAAAQEATSDRDPMAEFDLSSLLPREPPSSHEIVVTIRIRVGGGRS